MMGRKLMKQDEKDDNKDYSPRKKCTIVLPTTKKFNYS